MMRAASGSPGGLQGRLQANPRYPPVQGDTGSMATSTTATSQEEGEARPKPNTKVTQKFRPSQGSSSQGARD